MKLNSNDVYVLKEDHHIFGKKGRLISGSFYRELTDTNKSLFSLPKPDQKEKLILPTEERLGRSISIDSLMDDIGYSDDLDEDDEDDEEYDFL